MYSKISMHRKNHVAALKLSVKCKLLPYYFKEIHPTLILPSIEATEARIQARQTPCPVSSFTAWQVPQNKSTEFLTICHEEPVKA